MSKITTVKKVNIIPKTDLPSKASLAGVLLRKPLFGKLTALGLLLALIGVWYFIKYKPQLIVAKVNGEPILRSELNSKLAERFGKQTLEALIGERLILGEATQKQFVVDDAEIKSQITKVETTLKGQMSLDESLALQGMTRSDFDKQIRIQLLIEKILAPEITVSATEVAQYIKNNSKTISATTDAEKKLEAESELKNSKIAQKFTDWFSKLKEQAKIERFL